MADDSSGCGTCGLADFPFVRLGRFRHRETCRGSMQAISRDQAEKEIFEVVGSSGSHGPAPTLACWAVHAEAPGVEPFSRSKDEPSSTQVRSCRCVALAYRTYSGSPCSRGHRRWGNSGAPLASAIIIAVSLLLLNAAIYLGIGLILWFFGELFFNFFQRRS